MAATQGTFKPTSARRLARLGENPILHATGAIRLLLKGGQSHRLRRLLPGAAASLEGRFSHLPRNGMNYAFHIDAGLYAKFLRKFAEGFGVERIEGKIVDVKLDEASGNISSIKLDSGDVLEGDLFIDCTGFRGLLIGNALHVGYEDWSHHLFCDSAVALQTEAVGPAIPYTRSIAREAGWQWRIPLQHRVGNGMVYCSRYLADDAAKQGLLANVEGRVLTEPRVIKFRPGQRRQTWKRNCIAIGLSSGFIEPLESTSIHLIQRSIMRLLQMFPRNGICQSDVDEYNSQTNAEIEHIPRFHRAALSRDPPAGHAFSGAHVAPWTFPTRCDIGSSCFGRRAGFSACRANYSPKTHGFRLCWGRASNHSSIILWPISWETRSCRAF
jgi:tryptophan halogenase